LHLLQHRLSWAMQQGGKRVPLEVSAVSI